MPLFFCTLTNGKIILGKTKAWFGSNKVELTKDNNTTYDLSQYVTKSDLETVKKEMSNVGAKIVWSSNLYARGSKNGNSGSITCPVDFDYIEIYGDTSRFGYAPVIIPKNGSGYVSYTYSSGNSRLTGTAPITISNLTVTVSDLYYQSSGTDSGYGVFDSHVVFYKYTS